MTAIAAGRQMAQTGSGTILAIRATMANQGTLGIVAPQLRRSAGNWPSPLARKAFA